MSIGTLESIGFAGTYITIVRDPYARMVSAYHFLRRDYMRHLFPAVSKITEDAFMQEPIAAEFDNGQVRRLIPDGFDRPLGSIGVDDVQKILDTVRTGSLLLGTTEQLDASLAYFADTLAWSNRPNYWTVNVSSGRQHSNRPEWNQTPLHMRWDGMLHEYAQRQLCAWSDDHPHLIREFERSNLRYHRCMTPYMAMKSAKIRLRRLRRHLRGPT